VYLIAKVQGHVGSPSWAQTAAQKQGLSLPAFYGYYILFLNTDILMYVFSDNPSRLVFGCQE
jgi:hypothetical protein